MTIPEKSDSVPSLADLFALEDLYRGSRAREMEYVAIRSEIYRRHVADFDARRAEERSPVARARAERRRARQEKYTRRMEAVG